MIRSHESRRRFGNAVADTGHGRSGNAPLLRPRRRPPAPVAHTGRRFRAERARR